MPKGIPRAGYRRTNKLDIPSIEEIERLLVKRVPDLVEKLETLTRPLVCPHCGNQVRGPDRDSIIYLCNRAMGMPKQRTEIEVEHILNADQIDELVRKHLPQIVEIYGPEITALLAPVKEV